MIAQSISNKYFKLYSNCISVKGHNRSIIYDLGRGDYHFIPNSLHELLNDTPKKIIELFESHKEHEILEEYINFLLAKDLILLFDTIEEYECFLDLCLDWDSPYPINNSIIDLNTKLFKVSDYSNFINTLSNFRCQHVEVRVFDNIDLKTLTDFLDLFTNTCIIGIQLAIKETDEFTKESVIELKKDYSRVNSVFVHSCTDNEETILSDIIYSSSQLTSELCCGVIKPYYFSLSQDHFIEAHNFNTCTNRKISVSYSGDIKNCPSMSESYGHILDFDMNKILRNNKLIDSWKIKKDNIDICKDCEFRYMCSDCRAYLQEPENSNSKPLKCGYNPYTNKWEEWSKSEFKNASKQYYNM